MPPRDRRKDEVKKVSSTFCKRTLLEILFVESVSFDNGCCDAKTRNWNIPGILGDEMNDGFSKFKRLSLRDLWKNTVEKCRTAR